MNGYLVGAAQAAKAGGLGSQYVVARVRRIDAAKFRAAMKRELGGWQGALAASAVPLADWIPKAALDAGLPMLADVLRGEYGIDAELSAADTPPSIARSKSEFLPGIAVGSAFGAVLGWLATALFRTRGAVA